MQFHDSFGSPATLVDAKSVAEWDAAMRGILAHSAATPRHLEAVLSAEPHFALGHAAKGLFALLLGRAEMTPVARKALADAQAGAAEVGATAREMRYVAALDAYLTRRPTAAVEILEEVLRDHPGDALAMKLSQAIRFVMGDNKGMRGSVEAVLDAYGEDHPASGYAHGCHAFALEETGDYTRGEAQGLIALNRAPDDAWGLHAVAHVYDMSGRSTAGMRWLSARSDVWAHCNNFGYHCWWHLALFHLDQGDIARVLELYDTEIRRDHTDDYRDISNGAAMLMRLEINGVEVGERWEEMAELAAARTGDGCLAFADLHYVMALEGAGRAEESRSLIAQMDRAAVGGHDEMDEVARLAGLPAARGLAAFKRGDYASAFGLLSAAHPNMQRAGGSHAQRDVFSQVMIEAAIRAGLLSEARAALRARAARRGAMDRFAEVRLEHIGQLLANDAAANGAGSEI